jgi:hypothetical protein
MLPERTDATAKALLDTFGDALSVGLVLGFADGEGCEEDGLEKALETAASAIFQEHENQRKDALCFFPCTAILQAGRQMLEVWRTVSAAIRHAVQVCGMLEADLKEHEECADSTGLISKEKDDLVLKLQAARVLHDDKVEALETLTAVIRNGGGKVAAEIQTSSKSYCQTCTKKRRPRSTTFIACSFSSCIHLLRNGLPGVPDAPFVFHESSLVHVTSKTLRLHVLRLSTLTRCFSLLSLDALCVGRRIS